MDNQSIIAAIINTQDIIESVVAWALTSGLRIIILIIGAVIVNNAGKRFIDRLVRNVIKDEEDKESEKKREDTLIAVFSGVLRIFVWTMVLMMVLDQIGIDIGPILAGAGVIGLAIGFGAQYVIRDFLAGLFVIMENQYRVGDVVCLDGTCGGVEDITLRKTIMRDLDGKLMHIPNGSFKMAANLTRDYSRAHMDISVSYSADIDQVMDLINRVGKDMAKEEPWSEYILKPIQVAGPGPNKFAESGIEIKVLGETRPLKQWDTLKEFRRRLKIAFDKEGVEIPFPQMSIWPRGQWQK